jgi:hypothetical protein
MAGGISMKRITVGVLVLLLAAGALFAGQWARVQTYTGTISITLSGADSTGYTEAGFTPIQISEMTGGAAGFENWTYDAVTGWFYLGNLTDPGDSCTESYNDTLIVRYKVKSGTYSYTVEQDTVTLPGTTFFAWTDHPLVDPDKWVGGDSTSVYAYPNPDGDFQWWMADQFYIDYYCSDTAGTSGVLTGTISYGLKFFGGEE